MSESREEEQGREMTPGGGPPGDSGLAGRVRRDLDRAFSAFDEEVATLVQQIEALPIRPVALEAYWDGDMHNDWYVVLAAILARPSYDNNRYDSHDLKIYTWSSVKPFLTEECTIYPQGGIVKALGDAVASELGIAFHFDSPYETTLDPQRWWDTQPPAPTAEYEVEWRMLRESVTGDIQEESGRMTEVAGSPREAHQRVIALVTGWVTIEALQQQRLARIEFRIDLLGLDEGPVDYCMRLTPTEYRVWSSK